MWSVDLAKLSPLPPPLWGRVGEGGILMSKACVLIHPSRRCFAASTSLTRGEVARKQEARRHLDPRHLLCRQDGRGVRPRRLGTCELSCLEGGRRRSDRRR